MTEPRGADHRRRTNDGTRYAVDHPQMLEMGIGIRGLGSALIKGTKFCISASLAWRAIELIFKSDYDLVDFLGDITMDAAKAMVVIVAGIFLNFSLNELDDNVGLSVTLTQELRTALVEYQRINEWNFQYSGQLLNSRFGRQC